MSFAEAKAVVMGEVVAPRVERRPPPPPRPKAPPVPDGWPAFVAGLVAEAERTLWSDDGAEARAYLAGRKLSEATIRAARLGLFPVDRWVDGVFPDGSVWVPAGISIPWFEAGAVAMVNVRRPDEVVYCPRPGGKREPKYRTIRGSRRGRPYPLRFPVAAGRPLAIVEGEFEALILNQELAGLVGALTFGAASDRPKGRGLAPILPASPWFIATDNDPAGEASAAKWLAASDRCVRVRPPGGFKDWTEAAQGGVGLRRWWSERLSGAESPPLFTWDELAAVRWGPGLDDPRPGLDVGRDRPLRPL